MSEYRAKLLELFDEGNVGKDGIFLDLVNFISESDAKEFWEQYYDVDEDEDYAPILVFEDEDYEYDEDEDKDYASILVFEDEDYEYDGQPDEAQEWHDFDPDC